MSQHFEATFDSLRTYKAPEWFRDAKFGIWSHWGPQSVAMFGDWYARNMYIQGTPQYEYHVRHYGHPSKFGYKDLCQLWKAENFDPDALMGASQWAGAFAYRGAVTCACSPDGCTATAPFHTCSTGSCCSALCICTWDTSGTSSIPACPWARLSRPFCISNVRNRTEAW